MSPEAKVMLGLFGFALSSCVYSCVSTPDYEAVTTSPEDVHQLVTKLSTADWDMACQLYSYSSKSYLPNANADLLRSIRYRPGDWYVRRGQRGLVVIKTKENLGTIYIFPWQVVSRIEGPECVDRAGAKLSYNLADEQGKARPVLRLIPMPTRIVP